MTSFFTEGNMNIDTSHLNLILFQIQKKPIYDYNSILLSFFIISILIAYYKLNYPLFFKKYFNLKSVLYLGNQEDFFYRSEFISFGNLIPLVLYSFIISFFSVFVFEDGNSLLIDSADNFTVFQKWILFSFPFFGLIILRILLILLTLRFFSISIKFKKIYLLNFLRLTILFSVLNVFTSYLIYEVSSFELAFNFLTIFKLIIIFLRPLILYFYFKGFAPDIKSKIGIIIIISDFIPSLLLFDSLMLIDLFNYLISLI